MNRSEELAKLLGIEPKKEIAMHCGTNCIWHNCIMDRNCEHYKAIGAYPNFTKPDNFVKLLELYHNYNFPYFNGFEKRTALETMQCQLVNKCIRMLELKQCGAFKKLAQQTDWTY